MGLKSNLAAILRPRGEGVILAVVVGQVDQIRTIGIYHKDVIVGGIRADVDREPLAVGRPTGM